MATDPILSVQDVVAGYGMMTILNGTTFPVHRGAITTVIGPNGAGKSTVFKAIFGMISMRSGSVKLDGTEIAGKSPRDLLKLGVCYVPQGRNIFPELSVYTNIKLGAVSTNLAKAELDVRIDKVMSRFPNLRKKQNQQASTLSGGEQKQLEVARGLLLEPKLILIDEPSIGLSPMMVKETFGALTDLRDHGVSILMVEQNARSALQISDYAVVLELGRTRLFGPAQQILENPDVARLFLGGTLAA